MAVIIWNITGYIVGITEVDLYCNNSAFIRCLIREVWVINFFNQLVRDEPFPLGKTSKNLGRVVTLW